MPTTATVNISVFRKHKSHCSLHVPSGKVPKVACFSSSSSSPQQYPPHHNHRSQQSSGTYDAAVHAGPSAVTLPDYQVSINLRAPCTSTHPPTRVSPTAPIHLSDSTNTSTASTRARAWTNFLLTSLYHSFFLRLQYNFISVGKCIHHI